VAEQGAEQGVAAGGDQGGAPAGAEPLETLRRNYTPAFLAHLAQHDETSLSSAYELGRQAVAGGLSTLDIVQVHHAVFYDVVAATREVEEIADLLEAATTFLVESLAPFEMTRQRL
jgi:hypothetical protein